MHTHTSALTALQVFLMVVIVGTLWRLVAAELASREGSVGEVGKAMAVQF
jgi:hypothetical protein